VLVPTCMHPLPYAVCSLPTPPGEGHPPTDLHIYFAGFAYAWPPEPESPAVFRYARASGHQNARKFDRRSSSPPRAAAAHPMVACPVPDAILPDTRLPMHNCMLIALPHLDSTCSQPRCSPAGAPSTSDTGSASAQHAFCPIPYEHRRTAPLLHNAPACERPRGTCALVACTNALPGLADHRHRWGPRLVLRTRLLGAEVATPVRARCCAS
jgi:hypothetical protein